MNTVFFGSSKYSAIDEKEIHEQLGLSLVVTLPDRLNSKTKEIIPNPVKQYAVEQHIPVITTEKITDDIIGQIARVNPDFLVVADFGIILPKKLLELPAVAPLNVHHSLLPKYRGPSPVPAAILAGEQTVGVTIMFMNQKVDAGDILAQEKYELRPEDTTDSVLTKLNELGGNLAIQVIKDFERYYQNRTPQDESKATYSKYMTRHDGFIDLKNSLEIENWKLEIERAVRAYFPWPGAWTRLRLSSGGQAKIVKLLPGKLIQVEGKKPVGYKDFVNGYPEGKQLLEKLGLH